jgi:hypothetical protein
LFCCLLIIECEYTHRKLGSVQADFEATICEYLNDGPEGHAYAIVKNHSLREIRIFAFARKTYGVTSALHNSSIP